MKRLCYSVFLCFCCFLSFVIFLGTCPVIDAEAVVTYEQMSQSDTRALLGDRIPFNYVVDGVSGSDAFVYTGDYCGLAQTNIGTNPCFTSGSQTFVTDEWLVYTSETNHFDFMNKLCQISFDLDLYVSSDSEFYGCFALPITQSIYQSPISSDNSFSSYPFNFVNGINDCPASPFSDNSPNNGYYNTSIFTYRNMINNVVSNQYFRLFPYDHQESVTAVLADGVTFPYQRIVLLVYCPYVYGSLTNVNPALTTTTTTTTETSSGGGGTTIIINNSTDLTNTNSLIEQVKQSVINLGTSIVNGIKDLFIPDEEFVEDWVDDLQDLLEDHLGGLYQAGEIFTDIFEEFENATASSTIEIPACSISLAGETLTLGPYSVPLKVSGMPQILYDGIAWITDFLCLWAFLHMCRTKLEIFLVPESEAIKE